MRPDSFFRISVIDAGLHLGRHLRAYPELTVTDAIRQLRSGPAHHGTLDYETAMLIYNDNGASLFCPSYDRTSELRETLFKMALALKPFWATISPLGRQRVRVVLSVDQLQCLRYAGLIDSDDETAWRWWDQLAAQFRITESQKLIEIGREGELLSLMYERTRLAAEGVTQMPQWVSVEDNLAGYDILSYRVHDGILAKLYIEVKATRSAGYSFVLTRREWEYASLSPSSYLFHFWLLPIQALWIASVSELESSIPTDNGCGEWDQVVLNLEARRNCFVRNSR